MSFQCCFFHVKKAVVISCLSFVNLVTAQDLSQMAWQSLPLNNSLTQDISAQQKLVLTDFTSPAAFFRLDASQGTLQLHLESLADKKGIFVPTVKVFDENWQLV